MMFTLIKRHFLIDDPVWVRNFRPGKRWLPGTVKDRWGKEMYKVLIDGQTAVHCRHPNQLRTRLVILPSNDNSTTTGTSNQTSPTQNSGNQNHPPVLRRSTRIRMVRRPWSPQS